MPPSRVQASGNLGVDVVVETDVSPLGPLGLFVEGVYAHAFDRRLAAAGAVDTDQLGGYVGVLQGVTSWTGVGVRLDRFDPDMRAGKDALTQVNGVVHVYPAKPMRLTASYQWNWRKETA